MSARLINLFFILYIFTLTILGVIVLNTDFVLTEWAILGIRLDLVLHFFSFFPWSIFVFLMKRNQYLWLSYGLAFAGLTEFAQHFIIGRSLDMLDLKANIIGISGGFIAVLIFKVFQNRIRETKAQKTLN